MKKLFAPFSLLMTVCLLLQPLMVSAQNIPGYRPTAAAQKQEAVIQDFLRSLEMQSFSRRQDMTLQSLLDQLENTGYVDGRVITAVLSDKPYLLSLSAEEAAALAYLVQFAASSDQYPSSHWENVLLQQVLPYLTDYQEDAPDFAEKAFYAAVAVSLTHHPRLSGRVEDWAFKQVEQAADPLHDARNGWAAVVLADMSVESAEGEGWSASRRQRFEARMKQLIRRFDWLQNAPADYMIRGVKNVLNATNQEALLHLFAQANSFFALKDDDGVLKQMVSAGGFNALGRAMGGEEAAGARFSDTGEIFYLHAPTPGTDGKGHFADTVNGRRHFILSTLIQGLFLSYYSRETEASSQLMQQFIREYLTANQDSRFIHYLYIPLQGMRLGMVMHYSSSLYGWEKEEAALQDSLYQTLKKGYPWKVVCSGVQGACEITAEWAGIGKIIGWIGHGAVSGSKALMRQVVNALPVRAVWFLAMGQVTAKQGGKAVVRWSRQLIRNILQKSGWKQTASVVGAAAVWERSAHAQPSAPASRTASYQSGRVMSRQNYAR